MFENIDISIDQLPSTDGQGFNALEKKYRLVMMIYSCISSLFLIGGFVGFYFIQDDIPQTILIGVFTLIVLLVSLLLITTYLGFRKKKYKLRQKDIIFRNGLLWQSETSVPFVRIQHSEVIQGPIERFFNLAKLKLYTAGGHTSDLSIPGLNPEVAEDLKDYVTRKIVKDEEE